MSMNFLGCDGSISFLAGFTARLRAMETPSKKPIRPPASLRDKYGINTDDIRIDPVFIP